MTITEDPRGFYRIAVKYNPKLIAKIKEISGRKFIYTTKEWTVPKSERSHLERVAAYANYFSPVEWLNGNAPKTVEDVVYDLPKLKQLEIPHGLKIEPYHYQLEGIQRGLELKRFINGDDMGLGKTMQSIATINLANAFPCLVICPNVVKINWEREWHKFTDKKAMVLTDSVRDSWPFFWQTGLHQVFIVNYESLKKYFVLRIKKAERWTLRDVEFRQTINLFKSVIIDECHKCKSSQTHQAKFTKGIAAGKEWVIGLTGTPVVNKPKDLVAQLSILGRMEDFGGYKHFVQRYCSGPNEASNLKELNYNLWTKSFFRREKAEVLSELPEMTRQILSVDIDNRKEYIDAEKDLINYLIKYKDATDEKIQKALRGEVMVRIGILRDIAARGKMKAVVDFVKDFIENNQKVVIFCNLHDIVDRLLAAFPKAVCITGRQSMQEKQQSIDKFVNDKNTMIVIASIKAASAGVDGLQKSCSNVLFIEEPWTAADRDQAESRVHRNGLRDGATMYHMHGKNTIDEKMWMIIEEKSKISYAVVGGEDNVQTNIVDMMANLFNQKDDNDDKETF